MNSLNKYLTLMLQQPHLFRNAGEPGEIRIITDEKRILAEQKKLRAKFKKEGKPACWIDVGILAEDEWFYVLRDMVEFPNGRVGGHLRWIGRKSQEGGGFGSVLICVQSDRVIMIRKFRHEERAWTWEFPRGFGEPGLSAEENARKELLEEIGAKPVRLDLLAEVRRGKGGTCIFRAELSADQEILLDDYEGIVDYRWVTFDELDQMVRNGQLDDWFSLWAYAIAKQKT